ncbi:diguanylate cyclase (GGDEF) domain-containing protein [Pseudomonas seleniipraecipitans]|uniref:Diguanylate cyclase (GGDEF) domain-containing protein n=2 Tax=Phytopseudomonas seleniipraecipitans TaxID=640205 RepID=A0A1G7PZK3_9GAMM|nr:diguanylate cyclase (GGDEF) domain-containing protein [Pseudomonas seleniipraecipitans]
MQRLAIFLISLCMLSGLTLAARADVITLDANSSGRALNPHIELLEDPGARLSIDDMADPAVQQRFVPAQGKGSVGQSPNPWWIKVTLQAREPSPGAWWLEVAAVSLLDLQLFLPDGKQGWSQRRSGEAVAFDEGRDHAHRRLLFQLPALGEQPLTFYLRSYDPAGNSFPLKVWQLNDLNELAANENLWLGVIYGVITALLLYNLFIFLALRDSAYFWYVVTTTGALLMILGMTGHGFQYLWPNAAVPFWLDRISLPALWGFGACRFTQTLLQTRRHVPWAHHLLTISCALYVVAVIADVLGYRAVGAWIFVLLSFTAIPSAIWASLVRWRQGYFPACLYFCGYGMILASINLLLLRATGIVQPASWSTYVFPIAVAAESILFSFALAYRIQLLKNQRAEALLQADQEKTARLAHVQASANELQRAVEKRTAELKATNLQLSQREQELHHAAFHDALTELPNRRHLIEQFERAAREASQTEETLALLLIDLDHFKPINDRHGHDAGDLMLQQIGRRIREHVRTTDTVARLGGDEFAVLIEGADAQEYAHDIAGRLLTELARPVAYAEHALTVSISIGVAFYPQHAGQFAGLYKAADQALYQAKAAGRSGTAVYGEA